MPDPGGQPPTFARTVTWATDRGFAARLSLKLAWSDSDDRARGPNGPVPRTPSLGPRSWRRRRGHGHAVFR
jgi:hypothetical protein